MKKIFHSRLLDMRRLWLSITSYPTRARGIIVKYMNILKMHASISILCAAIHCFIEGGDSYKFKIIPLVAKAIFQVKVKIMQYCNI